jgi:hypothetical protein
MFDRVLTLHVGSDVVNQKVTSDSPGTSDRDLSPATHTTVRLDRQPEAHPSHEAGSSCTQKVVVGDYKFEWILECES